MPIAGKSSRKKYQTEKHSPAWYAGVRIEAREALERIRKRDALWRKRRAEAKARLGEAKS